MKKVAFFALSIIATAAMAVQPTTSGQIQISSGGVSVQTASLTNGTTSNTAQANTTALQNIASNAGTITIKGSSSQTAITDGGRLTNEAKLNGDFANRMWLPTPAWSRLMAVANRSSSQH